MNSESVYDIAIIGAGAAGLMAAIWAKRTAPERNILLLDRASRLGAKILISGGGRCNVTHHEVQAADYAGSSPPAIHKVLQQFDVAQTRSFFQDLGVELKQEATGKLFPVTDQAQTVLNALLRETHALGVRLEYPVRVRGIKRLKNGFCIETNRAVFSSQALILACGGKSFPKTGSDGSGYTWVQSLGHSLSEPILPALVPLKLPKNHFIRTLSGLSVDVRLCLSSATGKRLRVFEGALLCTHFGVSGPVVLDCSRHWLLAKHEQRDVNLTVCWTPGVPSAEWDRLLQQGGRKLPSVLIKKVLPERLARTLCAAAGVDPTQPCDQLTRTTRKELVRSLTDMLLPVSGDRGFDFAEVTAGGVPLRELKLSTLESRCCPGMYVCGELCDVDGRIGGFNFQWAWASGVVAGQGAGRQLKGL